MKRQRENDKENFNSNKQAKHKENDTIDTLENKNKTLEMVKELNNFQEKELSDTISIQDPLEYNPINNGGENNDKMTAPKQLTTCISTYTFNKYCEAVKQNTEEEFIKEFLDDFRKGNATSKDDVYTLLLIRAARLNNIEMAKHILSINHTENILTKIDYTKSSAISIILLSKNQQLLDIVDKYLNIITNKIPKTDIAKEDESNIWHAVKYPNFKDMSQGSCLWDFLYPIFTKESLEPLVDFIGDDHLDTLFYNT